MPQITTVDARGLFTKMLIAVYKETTRPTSFLRSFFRVVENDTKLLSIEVMRGTEKIAVDVLRGTEGNRNDFSRSSEKIFEPPYFREYFDATDLDFYDRLFGAAGGQVDVLTFEGWLVKVAEKLRLLQDKIERAYELQAAQVFSSGIVTLVNGDNIDFKRKAASLLVLGGGDLWSAAASDPISDLKVAAKFLRTAGKSTGGVVNAVFGELALDAFLTNPAVKERADIRNFKLDDITGPQREATGGVLHGRVTAGSWEVNIWTYPEFRDLAGVSTPYIDDKEVFVIPLQPNFVHGFASVPKIFRDSANAEFPEFIQQVRAAFVIGNYVDSRTDKHVFDIKSAGLPIPVAIDQIHTTKVLA
ncbi:MAG: major capsid protein [Candidatus Anammoxibacter sp.]